MTMEAEQAVIGGLLLNSAAIRDVDLSPDEFADEINAEIYRACTSLALARIPMDWITVMERMGRKDDTELMRYLSEVGRNTPSAANIAAYAKMVRETHRKRQAMNIGQELVLAVEHEGMGAVDHAISRLMDLGKSSRQYEFTIKEALKAAYDKLAAAHEGTTDTIPTGTCSPVREDSSKVLLPSTMIPSAGSTSPGAIRSRSPGLSSTAGTSSSPDSVNRRAV